MAGSAVGMEVKPEVFLEKYCFECHGKDEQKGDRRFDEMSFPVGDEHGIIEAQDIIDQLTLEDMPPGKAKRQPSEEERAAMIAVLTEGVGDARAQLASTGAQTVLRRLNQREYRNTIGDLLGMNMVSFDPTTKFPADKTVEHMDNIGDVLVTSGYLLDQYLESADVVVEKALGMREKPKEQKWRFKGNFQQGQELDYSHKRVYNYRYLCVYEVPNTLRHEGGYAAIHDFSEGVPEDGWYEVRALAHALHRENNPYDPEIFGMDLDEPFRLGIVPGDVRVGTLHHPQPIEPQLAEVTVKDGGKPEWYTMRVWLEKGQTPRFTFPNGMRSCRGAFSAIANRYKDHWPKGAYRGGIVEARKVVLEHGKMPHIRIHEVAVRGPIYEEWPPEPQRIVFGKEGYKEGREREVLEQFAERAYRRPVTKDEVDRLMSVVEQRRKEGRSAYGAMKDGVKAVLCSPGFLYLAEPEEKGGKLGAHDLASRLSYFLWATMPDEELRALADSGELLKPEVLEGQLARMLADERSEAFVGGFLDSWLNLRALGDMPPDRELFSVYYTKNFQEGMKEEARLFLRNLLETDGPVTDFIDSDYAFVNKYLAEHYGIEGGKWERGKAHEFQRVSLRDSRRGGLLGMGGVLTVTANGIETSPVTRGVWVLENVLGTPPAPPPDDVPAIDPDVRGATTVRDILAKHRDIAACNDCHRKIDPPGFALENFDPIGGWRSHYPAGRKQGPKVDASSELASGGTFEDVGGLKELLLERKDFFVRMLAERLLTYATGRRVEGLDRAAVDEIVATTGKKGDGMRSLVEEVVGSEVFLRR
ncbi:MAG: DUF1592 domain-containing protein [Verrucomicrobiota bacterium]